MEPTSCDVGAQLHDGEFARAAKQWVEPFQAAFPDFSMKIVELVAEEEKVAAHFRCSGTHLREWIVPTWGERIGRPRSSRRFQDVDEIYIFRVRNGKLTDAAGVEDNLIRMRQLGLDG